MVYTIMMVRYVKLVRQGSSLVATIPAPFRDALALKRGDVVAVTQVGETIVFARVDEREIRREVLEKGGRV